MTSLECSICHEPLLNPSTDPLSTTLCPSTGCVAVSHLKCLSEKFLSEEPGRTAMIPRGGHCQSCGNYTLWGDVVRGCYRRLPPVERTGQDLLDIASDDMFLSDEDDEDNEVSPKKRTKTRRRSRSSSKRRKSRKHKVRKATT
ncbi:hypothetical protein BDZ97DRAFT_1333660 [Flammula alnicola]|nr:hypothetical protein BDZ97DRAFT_1333660 [Flammula alnicola]